MPHPPPAERLARLPPIRLGLALLTAPPSVNAARSHPDPLDPQKLQSFCADRL